MIFVLKCILIFLVYNTRSQYGIVTAIITYQSSIQILFINDKV